MLRFKFILISVVITVLFICARPICAQQHIELPLKLAWNRNAESDLSHYRVYYGTSSRNYSYYVPVDKQYPSCDLDENYLTVGRTYHIALTALDYSLNESGYSEELVVYIESAPTNTTSSIRPTTTTTTVPPSNQKEYCSTDPTLVLHGAMPEEGTMRVTIPDNLSNAVSATLSLTLFDPDVSGEGYIYINSNDPVDLPVGNYDDSVHTFEVPVNLNWLIQGENTIRFTHVSSYGYEVRELCVRIVYQTITTTIPLPTTSTTTIPSMQERYCSTDPVVSLHGGIPEEGTMSVTIPDNLSNAISATLSLTLFDADVSGEGYIYINNNDSVDLPICNYDYIEHSFEVPINLAWLIQGENIFRFTHVATWGYEVRELCVRVEYQDQNITTTLSPAIPVTTTTTAPIASDETPPTGTMVINNGDEITYSQSVTLYLSVEDDNSGMGEGAQMMFSNDSIQWSDPEPYSAIRIWNTSPGEGIKTVYAQFCDAEGNWIPQPVSDSIFLETSLACVKPVQLDSTATESSGSRRLLHSKEKAVDGKTNTGWLSPFRLSMQDEYIILDLGETKIVNRIELFSHPFLLSDLFPLDFQIMVSTDNEKWTELFAEENYSSPSSRTDSWIFEEVKAHYIMMNITKSRRFLRLFHAAYIAEIKVHGCAENDTLGSQLHSITPADHTKTGGVTLPDSDAPDEKKPPLVDAPPGRPGKPFFLLNNSH